MTVKECLIEARKLIEKGFTKNRAAADKWRKEVDFDSPKAVAFDIYGAMRKSGAKPDTRDRAERRIKKAIGGLSIISFNDAKTTKKDDVLAVFDKAIAGCR